MRAALIFAAIILTGCAAGPGTGPAVNAIVTNPGPDTTQELEAILSAALERKTRIAHDAFTTDSLLIIDPPFNDRSFARPDKFRLQVRGNTCALLHVERGASYTLQTTRCAPVT